MPAMRFHSNGGLWKSGFKKLFRSVWHKQKQGVVRNVGKRTTRENDDVDKGELTFCILGELNAGHLAR